MPLIQLGLGYVVFSVLVAVSARELPGMSASDFVLYSTIGASLSGLTWVFWLGWHRVRSSSCFVLGGVRLPKELLLIIPSGICAALVLPVWTLVDAMPGSTLGMGFLLPAAAVVIHRVVDAVQIRQGVLKKRVLYEEDAAMALALLALGGLGFSWRGFLLALGCCLPYGIRIYLMNLFKNTRPRGALLGERGYFAMEQIFAALTLILGATAMLWFSPETDLRRALLAPEPGWAFAILAGVGCAGASLFLTFTFLYPGRNATFTGLINPLGPLIAGLGLSGSVSDWISLALMLGAVAFLGRAERKRVKSRILRGFFDEVSVRLRWSTDQPDRGGAPGESDFRRNAFSDHRPRRASDPSPPGPR